LKKIIQSNINSKIYKKEAMKNFESSLNNGIYFHEMKEYSKAEKEL